MRLIYSLIPNFKSYSVPTKVELNNSPEGSKWLFECEWCDSAHMHIKQLDNSWKCTNCGITEINLQEDKSKEVIMS